MPILSRVTFGFETEFHQSYEENMRVLESWFGEIIWDGSGVLEIRSPPFRPEEPVPAIAVGLLAKFDSYFIEREDDYGDVITAGQHVHIGSISVDTMRELFKTLAVWLPTFQHMFCMEVTYEKDRIWLSWSEKRDYWARPVRPSDWSWAREYWAVTYNPDDDSKPPTLEIRMCESWPLNCIAAVLYILVAFEEGLEPRYKPGWYVGVVEVDKIRGEIERLEDTRTGRRLPVWARRLMRVSLTERPVGVPPAYKRAVVGKELPRKAVEAMGFLKRTRKPSGLKRVGNAVAEIYRVEMEVDVDGLARHSDYSREELAEVLL